MAKCNRHDRIRNTQHLPPESCPWWSCKYIRSLYCHRRRVHNSAIRGREHPLWTSHFSCIHQSHSDFHALSQFKISNQQAEASQSRASTTHQRQLLPFIHQSCRSGQPRDPPLFRQSPLVSITNKPLCTWRHSSHDFRWSKSSKQPETRRDLCVNREIGSAQQCLEDSEDGPRLASCVQMGAKKHSIGNKRGQD